MITQGPYSAFPPSSPAAGDIWKATDSPLQAFYNGVTWDWRYGSTPTILPPVFSFSENLSSSFIDQTRGYIRWNQGNNGSVLSSLYNTLPAPPYKVTIGLFTDELVDTSGSVSPALFLRSASGQYQPLFLYYSGNFAGAYPTVLVNFFNAYNSFNTNRLVSTDRAWISMFSSRVYLQIEDDGTTLYFRVGLNKNKLLEVFNYPRAADLTGGPVSWGILSFGDGHTLDTVFFDAGVA